MRKAKTKSLIVLGFTWIDGWWRGATGDIVVGQRQYMRTGGGQYADRAEAVANCGEHAVKLAEAAWELSENLTPIEPSLDGAMQWRRYEKMA